MPNDLVIISIVSLYTITTLALPVYLETIHKVNNYIARKVIHSFSGLGVFAINYLQNPKFALLLALIIAGTTFFSRKDSPITLLRKFYKAISENEEKRLGYLQGPFAYSIAIVLVIVISILLPGKHYFAISALMIMIFADTAASVVGKKYGKTKVRVPYIGDKRSLEGSIAFFVTAFFVCLLTFYLTGNAIPGTSAPLEVGQIILYSGVIGFVGTIFELLSPSKWDDLIIPIGTLLTTSLLFS